MKRTAPKIEDLAIVGDRRTAALLDKQGSVVWYCPGQFDAPTLLAALLDAEKGGSWALTNQAGLSFVARRYREQSGVLETTLAFPETAPGPWQATDFMPLGDGLPRGLCRRFSAAPAPVTVTLRAAPNYARDEVNPHFDSNGGVYITENVYLYASAALELNGGEVRFTLPPGVAGWAFLGGKLGERPDGDAVDGWLETTLASWRKLESHTAYRGPYRREVENSLRALRLLTFDDDDGHRGGGIIGAVTSSLPEVVGGARNYDYRYVWLRDAGMGVRALLHEDSDGAEGRRFLNFIAECAPSLDGLPMPPFFTVRGEVAPDEFALAFSGYEDSRPVQIGNGAHKQLQLDGYGDVLLAACLVYEQCYPPEDRSSERLEHWDTMRRVAEFLVTVWREPDYGIWEEREKKQNTVGKVLTACSLEALARFAPADDAARWRAAAQAIRKYVARECMTSYGAYAAVAGGEAVDVSAALFPVWGYADADSPEMKATITAVDEQLARGPLYHRHLERFDSMKEGAFLAGTFWVAHYWVLRRDFTRARSILDAALGFANDLGLWSEEADGETGQVLGNFPQTITHAAFISAVLDLRRLERKS